MRPVYPIIVVKFKHINKEILVKSTGFNSIKKIPGISIGYSLKKETKKKKKASCKMLKYNQTTRARPIPFKRSCIATAISNPMATNIKFSKVPKTRRSSVAFDNAPLVNIPVKLPIK